MSRLSVKRTTQAEVGASVPIQEALPPEANDYIRRNRAAWEQWALNSRASARAIWRDEELRWGIWGIGESELGLLRDVEVGADIIELGCGTAAISAWLARQGVRPVAVDFSRRQLETVERLQLEFSLSFPVIHADAEQVPYDEANFDLVVSEYGASLWCDPHRWLAEAQRLLRPEGRLIFVTSAAMLITCTPTDGSKAGEKLARDYFSRYVLEFPGEDTVEFHLTHGDWVRALRDNGFFLENLIEVQAPAGGEPRLEFASLEWARRWPSEEIWVARKLAF